MRLCRCGLHGLPSQHGCHGGGCTSALGPASLVALPRARTCSFFPAALSTGALFLRCHSWKAVVSMRRSSALYWLAWCCSGRGLVRIALHLSGMNLPSAVSHRCLHRASRQQGERRNLALWTYTIGLLQHSHLGGHGCVCSASALLQLTADPCAAAVERGRAVQCCGHGGGY